MVLEIALIIVFALFMLAGLIGSVIPALPGPPISYVGVLLLHFFTRHQFSTTFLIVWLIVVVLVQLLDYGLSIWGTKRFGGSRAGVWGSVAGLFIGLTFGPLGIIIGPFAGALAGELLNRRSLRESLRSATGSLMGFLLGTVLKLIISGMLFFYFVQKLFEVSQTFALPSVWV